MMLGVRRRVVVRGAGSAGKRGMVGCERLLWLAEVCCWWILFVGRRNVSGLSGLRVLVLLWIWTKGVRCFLDGVSDGYIHFATVFRDLISRFQG